MAADWLVRRTPGWRGGALWLVTEFATRAILLECLVLLAWRPPLGLPVWAHVAVEVYAFVEVLFAALYVLQKRRLSARAACIPRQNHLDRQPLAERAAALDFMLRAIGEAIGPDGDRADEVTSWFIRTGARTHDEAVVSWPELRAENIADWLAWALWQGERGSVDPAELRPLVARVQEWVHEAEGAADRAPHAPVPAGHNPALFACRLTLDTLRCAHRPLLAYLVTHGALGALCHLHLSSRGFAPRASGRIKFWHRRGDGGNGGSARRPPLVFLAGIGVGLVSYMPLIDGLLAAQPGRELLLIELDNICLRFSLAHEVETPEQMVRRLREVLAACGCEAAHWVGHSFGTIVISWILRLAPSACAAAEPPTAAAVARAEGTLASADMPSRRTRGAARAAAAAAPSCVAACTFIDPIPFLLYKANVAVRFCYRPARTPLDRLVRYFVAQELGVSYTLHRHFSWPHNVLDPQLLAGIPTSVVLSELDTYVPSLAVSRHLAHRAPHASVRMLRGHAHSQFCVSQEGLQAVLDAIRETDAHVVR